jgi:formylglycine-generating enzyme required for sulfatase activity
MGNSVAADTDLTDATPVTATVSAYYMDKYEVTKALWDEVKAWAATNGYAFDHAGSGKAANHPVQTVNWYDVVKWCNARSQMEGRTPAYYTDAPLTQVYKGGQVAPYVNWNGGYRLPTEAEREKAARGGLSGQRFPWGNEISQDLANYLGDTAKYSYDLGPNGYNPMGLIGEPPYTTPVGSFAPNGYGLYDMAGNVFEWCWDWYQTPYAGGSNPRGPASGSGRIGRGGAWNKDAAYGPRCALRSSASPDYAASHAGFRSVLPPPAHPAVVPDQSLVVVGGSVTLSLTNTLNVPSTYQWQFNGTNLPGATGPTLALISLTLDQSGRYRATVINAFEVVTTSAAVVQVVDRVTISSQPQGTNATNGASVTLSVAAVSPSPITYQWQFNGVDLPGQIGTTLTLTNVQLAHDGLYTVVATDALRSVTSEPATLVVLIRPVIVQAPLSQSVVVGGSVTFSIEITGNPAPFTYQWRQGPTTLTNMLLSEKKAFFTLNNVQTNQGGLYRVVLANAASPTISGASPNVSWNLTVLPDADGDGLPDAWETAHGLSSTDVADASFDSDSDGQSNLSEYRSGTNPTNATSCLKLEAVIQDNGVMVSFNAVSNQTYTVEWCVQPGGGAWSRLADVVARASDRLEIVIDQNAGDDPRFYRVVTPRWP